MKKLIKNILLVLALIVIAVISRLKSRQQYTFYIYPLSEKTRMSYVDDFGFSWHGDKLVKPVTTLAVVKPKRFWVGEASWYSRKYCLGCSKSLIMANGKPLDDTKLTIAFNKLPLNTKILIRNMDNDKIATAIVTDTGGFYRHNNRIADLTKAVRDKLDCWNCQVMIKEINELK